MVLLLDRRQSAAKVARWIAVRPTSRNRIPKHHTAVLERPVGRIDCPAGFDTPDDSQQLRGIDLLYGLEPEPRIEILFQKSLTAIDMGFRPAGWMFFKPLAPDRPEGVRALLQAREFFGAFDDAGVDTVNEQLAGVCATVPRLGQRVDVSSHEPKASNGRGL
jgi:hypothetical protein